MADFKTALISDGTISDISDELTYGVVSGASSNTFQQFLATSNGPSSLIFQVQIPSESIIVSREILIQSTVTWQIAISNVPTGSIAFDYAQTSSVACFPLNKLFTTVTAGINNCNVIINLLDVLPSLLKLNDSRELCK